MRSCCNAPSYGSHPCAGYEAAEPDRWCFISSACIMSKGLPDDCDELETLRKFRDILTAQDPGLAKLCREYYTNAPKIVEKINQSENSKAAYDKLYNDLVVPCVAKLKEGQIDEAVKLYTDIYRGLLKEYDIIVTE